MLNVPKGERVNTFTHGSGFVLSCLGAIALMARVIPTGDAWRIVACFLFAFSLVSLYFVSMLSHAIESPEPRRFFRILDQAFIYLLIVGTSTPFAMVYLRTFWWLVFFSLMWIAAFAGFVSKLWYAHRIDSAQVWSYVVLGWMTSVPMVAVAGSLPLVAVAWIVAGGLAYTGGTYFFIKDHSRYHFHGIWHSFVLAGSICHFMAVFLFVAR